AARDCCPQSARGACHDDHFVLEQHECRCYPRNSHAATPCTDVLTAKMAPASGSRASCAGVRPTRADVMKSVLRSVPPKVHAVTRETGSAIVSRTSPVCGSK